MVRPVKGCYNIEYQSFCLVVWIGSPHAFPRKRVCLPLGPKWGGDTLVSGGDELTETLVLFTVCPLIVVWLYAAVLEKTALILLLYEFGRGAHFWQNSDISMAIGQKIKTIGISY